MSLGRQINTSGRRVLVVDDNVVNQKVLCKVLEGNGYDVQVASDGPEALDKIKKSIPDIVLLDVEMPEMNGFEVCRRIKAAEKTAWLPVIFITATDTIEGTLEGFDAGAVDYITRPFQVQEVLARVENQLMITKLQKQSDEENERLERILAALPLPYMISRHSDGTILEMNALAQSALDISKDEATQYRIQDFYTTPQVRNHLLSLVEKRGLIVNEEIELRNRAGMTFTSLLSATPMMLDGEKVFFVTFNDITKRKEMERELEKAASTDYLTGVLNRRAFSVRANAERKRADRNGHPLALLMIDIDHFKKINDTYGHDVGDEALKTLVNVVSYGLRLSDVLGRIGGEEFVLVLPETGYEGAKILAERIRLRIEEHKMVLVDGTTLSMTISAGLCAWDKGISYEEAIKIADERLYLAKENGRNLIVSEDVI